MADINVERRGPSIWPWIVGLIVLALVVYFVAGMMRGDGGGAEADGANVEAVQPAGNP